MPLPTLLVCQNTACRRSGAAKVLAAFESRLGEASGVTLIGCRCLGQCGNGPVVLLLPEQIWYRQVHPDEVPMILQRHSCQLSCRPDGTLEPE